MHQLTLIHGGLSHRALRPITGRVTPVGLRDLLHFPAPKLLEFKALPLGWLLDPDKPRNFTNRILAQLFCAEVHEPDPWMRDDYRIAWITTLYASQGNPQPHVDATYRVLGLHPDKVWQAILDRRAALLGRNEIPHKTMTEFPMGTGRVVDEEPNADGTSTLPAYESPKKPCATERNPRKKAA